MCVAVLGKILSIDEELMAVADFGGTTREISVALLPEPVVGDYIIVHAGFALHKVDPNEAKETMEMMENILDGGQIS